MAGISTADPPPALALLDYDDEVEVSEYLAVHAFDYYEDKDAVATTFLPHGFLINKAVKITNVAGSDSSLYNSTPFIKDVPHSKVFVFELAGRPTTSHRTARFITIDTENDASIRGLRPLESIIYCKETGRATCRIQNYTNYLDLQHPALKHRFYIGERIWIHYAGHANYNGLVTICGIPSGQDQEAEDRSDVEFEFFLGSDPGMDSSRNPDFAAGYYGRIWQINRLIIENNIIELAIWPKEIPAYGIRLWGSFFWYSGNKIYRFPQVFIGGNIIRNVNKQLETDGSASGIDLWSCEHAFLKQNIINLNSIYPITYAHSGIITAQRNIGPSGIHLEFMDRGGDGPYALLKDIEASIKNSIEEAEILSFI